MSESDNVRIYLMSESEIVKVKQSVQNISYFNKDTIFTIREKQIIDNIIG